MPYHQLSGYVPPTEENEQTEEASVPNITHGTRLWSIISIILSAVGALLVVVPAIGAFFGVGGVGFAVFSRRRNGYFYRAAVAGIIIGAIAIASCLFFIVFNAMSEAGMVVNLFDELIK